MRPKYIPALLFLFWCGCLYAEFTREQLDWLESEDEHPRYVNEVNEGELSFLATPPEKDEHQQSMQATLSRSTIETGWARVDQCHRNLDQVSSLEIVFHADRVRALSITSYSGMRKAYVVGPRVIVKDIQSESSICLSAESRIFSLVEKNESARTYEMVNGPFMRRFLDGYYPISLDFSVSFPHEVLTLSRLEPQQQAGWLVERSKGYVHMQGRFEGRLLTRLTFADKHQ